MSSALPPPHPPPLFFFWLGMSLASAEILACMCCVCETEEMFSRCKYAKRPLAMHAIMKNQHNKLPFQVCNHYPAATKGEEESRRFMHPFCVRKANRDSEVPHHPVSPSRTETLGVTKLVPSLYPKQGLPYKTRRLFLVSSRQSQPALRGTRIELWSFSLCLGSTFPHFP
jgi:hypothetical protein